jgi:hypothetical protein
MAPGRRISELLADWRAKAGLTGDTRAGSVARTDAERAERRARWEYENESIREHDRHGLADTPRKRLERAAGRSDMLRRDAADRVARPGRLADEAELERELGE